MDLVDAYKSLTEALVHAGIQNKLNVKIKYIDSEKVESDNTLIQDVDAILVPGGFGSRGIEGKINAVRYARENKIPYLGICLGMQIAVIEYARHKCGLKNANSTEFDPKTNHPVVGLIEEWIDRDGTLEERDSQSDLGGTMRLGSQDCHLVPGSQAQKIYDSDLIRERHRHRYEVNNNLRDKFEKNGLIFSGMSPDKKLPEIIELKNHPWFIGVQFHPEFKSRPFTPHPLFSSFIKAAGSNGSIK